MDLKDNIRLITLAKALHLRADLANGKSADICVAWCVHTAADKDVFLFDSRSFGIVRVGVTFACELILHGAMYHSGLGRVSSLSWHK